MVSHIVPGTTGASTLGVDSRFSRTAQPQRRDEPANADRVELSASALNMARESVRAGMAQVHEALAAGHDAQALLVAVQGLAKSADQSGLNETLAAYSGRINAAIDRGARVLAGEDILVQAEPGAPPVTISGLDLRLKAEPKLGDLIVVSAQASADDAALAQAAQKSMEALQEAMGQLIESARALEAHTGFLAAAESGARGDFDADGARLLALQVRQGLEAVGAAPIANADPQAVLSLFRA
jgi:hypothetical protein